MATFSPRHDPATCPTCLKGWACLRRAAEGAMLLVAIAASVVILMLRLRYRF